MPRPVPEPQRPRCRCQGHLPLDRVRQRPGPLECAPLAQGHQGGQAHLPLASHQVGHLPRRQGVGEGQGPARLRIGPCPVAQGTADHHRRRHQAEVKHQKLRSRQAEGGPFPLRQAATPQQERQAPQAHHAPQGRQSPELFQPPAPVAPREAPRRRRPEVCGRRPTEAAPVARQGPGVPVRQPLPLREAASRWAVVQGHPQHLRAELLPVGAGVEQVLVPGTIHRLRWAHPMAGIHRQKQKAPVLPQHPLGAAQRPALLPRQLAREGPPLPLPIGAPLHQPLQQLTLGGCVDTDGPLHDDDSERGECLWWRRNRPDSGPA